MKKTTLLLLVILLTSTFVSAGTGWYSDFVKINVNGTGTTDPTGWYWIGGDPSHGTVLQGTSLGTVTSLAIEGCDMKYWRDSQDRTGGSFFYQIKSADGSTVVVSPVETIWDQAKLVAANDYEGTKTTNINLLAGLTYGTTYQLHVWAKSWGSGQGDSWLSNGSANYVATFTVPTPTAFNGTYKVGTGGFASLKSAIDAIQAGTVTGNVVLEINADLTEPANFGLGKDLSGYSLTIRPDADVNRTITYTQSTANTGPWGHFVIGVATANLNSTLTDAMVIATNNVTIDGYAVGGSTRRLSFTTSAASLAGSSLFNIVGGCANAAIKNCILNDQSSNQAKCIYINQFKGTTTDASPSNTLITNNVISANSQTFTSTGGYGIQCSRTGTATTKITGLQITNNIITASNECVEIYYCNGATITGNEIKVERANTIGSGTGIWLRGSAGDMYVTGNKFTELVSAQTGTGTYATQGILTGATSVNPFNVYIFNNIFSGMNRSVSGPAALNQSYIAEVGYGTTKIYNNSFYMPALTLPTQAGAYNAISFTTASYKADVQNNIFISNEDAKSVLISKVITTGPVNNNVYYLRAGNTNAKVVDTYATLLAYQTANPTLDVNSKSVDVNFTNAATGDFTLTGASIQDANLAVPRLASVLTDFTGSNRNASTYAGAYESTPFIFTGVNQVTTGAKILTTVNGVRVNCSKISDIEIYTFNGMLLDKVKNTLSFDRSLQAGIYLIKVNNVTTKFIK